MKLLLKATLAAAAALPACATGGPPPPPLAPAAMAEGERLYAAHCYGCHSLDPDANTPAAPTLAAIVGKRVAAEPGYNYSPALRAWAAAQPTWTEPALDRFLANPEATVPGTEMSYPGLPDPQARTALIAWLRDQ